MLILLVQSVMVWKKRRGELEQLEASRARQSATPASRSKEPALVIQNADLLLPVVKRSA
ncbi:MAG: hypothetical protein P1V34_05415 [Alphaproteobacteria bacterium]|nr:hypothetical protein [Alphaproteobacteria bacterium]